MKFILSLLLVVSFSAIAQTNKKNEEVNDSESAQSNSRFSENESATNRENVQHQIVVSLVGAGLSLPSVGISYYHFLTPDSLLGVSLLSFKDTEEDGYDGDDYLLYKGSAIRGTYKKFEGNSFYWEPNVYYRSLKTADSISFTTPATRSGDAEFTDFGVGIKIGNQWQWENFTIGCDWIGVEKRIALISVDKNEDSDFLNQGNYATLLNFYLGASF